MTCESLSSLAPGLLVAAGGKQHNSVVRLAAAAPGSFSLSSPAGAATVVLWLCGAAGMCVVACVFCV